MEPLILSADVVCFPSEVAEHALAGDGFKIIGAGIQKNGYSVRFYSDGEMLIITVVVDALLCSYITIQGFTWSNAL